MIDGPDHALMTNKACRPPAGKTYLTIGQDLFSIQEYLDEQYNASLHRNSTRARSSFAPAAVMVYTDIQSLVGLDRPVDYGSGVEYADGVLEQSYPTQGAVGLQIGLWLNGTTGCRQIVDGTLKSQIDKLFHYLLHHCHATTRIFLRVGYEFDNPSFGYDSNPPLYRRAFQKLVAACEQRRAATGSSSSCRDKVKFVWHSWGATAGDHAPPLDAFYPGDDVVDWVGVSVFQQVYSNSTMDSVKQVLQFAADHGKPTMIAESTPFGGITSWEDWFQPTLDLIEDYDISMWSYINCNWDGQAMWHNVGFGDTRLSTNINVMHQWYKHVIEGNRFLGSNSLLNCGITAQGLSMTTRSAFLNASTPNQYSNSTWHPFAVVVLVLISAFTLLGTWQWRRVRCSSSGGQSIEPSVSPIPRSNRHNSYGAVQSNNSAKMQT